MVQITRLSGNVASEIVRKTTSISWIVEIHKIRTRPKSLKGQGFKSGYATEEIKFRSCHEKWCVPALREIGGKRNDSTAPPDFCRRYSPSGNHGSACPKHLRHDHWHCD